MVSLLDPGRFRLSSMSTRGSRVSRLKSSQPCLILTLARARRFCSARVICRASISTQCLGGGGRGVYL